MFQPLHLFQCDLHRFALTEHGNVSKACVECILHAVVYAARHGVQRVRIRADRDALAAHALVFVQNILRWTDLFLPARDTGSIQLKRIAVVDARAQHLLDAVHIIVKRRDIVAVLHHTQRIVNVRQHIKAAVLLEQQQLIEILVQELVAVHIGKVVKVDIQIVRHGMQRADDHIERMRADKIVRIRGPDVVKSVTQEEVSKEDLGGVGVHMTKSGVAHLSAENDIECINYIRELISYLPGNNMEEPPFVATSDSPTRLTPELSNLVPTNPNQPYDIKEMIEAVADDNSFFELQAEFAANIVTGYIRLNGKTVGVVANQPLVLAGTLDINASVKAARFVRFCDAFNIPLLTLVDVPGFLPGVDQEYGGIIRNGAKLLYAYCEATVPKVTVITRKAYGGAYDVMSSKHIRGDVNLAYPTAEIAVMGPDGAVNILFKKEIEKSQAPAEKRKELQDDYREKFANPYRAAELGYVDEVIDPAMTRLRLIRSFEMLANKRQSNPPRKHSNIPL